VFVLHLRKGVRQCLALSFQLHERTADILDSKRMSGKFGASTNGRLLVNGCSTSRWLVRTAFYEDWE
jgi:hypothetical protein